MKEKIKYLVGKKSFHISIIIIIVAVILFVLGIIVLRYNVEGETNMPFNLEKITLISSAEGIDKDSKKEKWFFDVSQNNDIYLYIERNQKYNQQEIIKTVLIENIQIQKDIEKGIINIYKPDNSKSTLIFNNYKDNICESIEYKGDLETNLKDLKISNQGGLIAFRYANDNMGEYKSNDEQINHNELLEKVKITEDDIKATIKFDIIIKTQSGKQYKGEVSLDTPVEGVIKNGTSYKEITNLENVIFKRIKN